MGLPMASSQRDPVCGMAVDSASAAATVVHDGQTYLFCSKGCATRFRADPARHLTAGPEGMQKANGAEGPGAAGVGDGDSGNYTPLIVVIGLIFLTTVVLAAKDWQEGRFDGAAALGDFMTGFFLVFAGFKLIDLRGFAEGYATYDLLARKVPAYGYVYPFIELGFGFGMLWAPTWTPLLVAEIVVMAFSGLGVGLKLAKGEKFQCACLGTFLKVPLTKVTLVEDFGMAALAGAMLMLA